MPTTIVDRVAVRQVGQTSMGLKIQVTYLNESPLSAHDYNLLRVVRLTSVSLGAPSTGGDINMVVEYVTSCKTSLGPPLRAAPLMAVIIVMVSLVLGQTDP